jgi:hypothetical protein
MTIAPTLYELSALVTLCYTKMRANVCLLSKIIYLKRKESGFAWTQILMIKSTNYFRDAIRMNEATVIGHSPFYR